MYHYHYRPGGNRTEEKCQQLIAHRTILICGSNVTTQNLQIYLRTKRVKIFSVFFFLIFEVSSVESMAIASFYGPYNVISRTLEPLKTENNRINVQYV